MTIVVLLSTPMHHRRSACIQIVLRGVAARRMLRAVLVEAVALPTKEIAIQIKFCVCSFLYVSVARVWK
jgi:hypothetical protein